MFLYCVSGAASVSQFTAFNATLTLDHLPRYLSVDALFNKSADKVE